LRWDPHLKAGGHRVSITWRDVGVEDGLTFNSDERLGLTLGTTSGKLGDCAGENWK